MQRRKAITAAAAASLTLLAGATGVALNSGIVAVKGDDNVGQLSPVTVPVTSLDATPLTVYVDDTGSNGPRSTAPAVTPSTRTPVTTSNTSTIRTGDDDSDDDERAGEHDDARDSEHEYEGADDDD
jgi:hypothetical protein